MARRLTDAATEISARDALNAAIMRANSVHRILSFDPGFDAIPHIARLY